MITLNFPQFNSVLSSAIGLYMYSRPNEPMADGRHQCHVASKDI